MAQAIIGNTIAGTAQHLDVLGVKRLTNIDIREIDNDNTAAHSFGIEFVQDDCVMGQYYVSGCTGTGVLVAATADETMLSSGRSTGNGTNYTDSGTNTNLGASVSNT